MLKFEKIHAEDISNLVEISKKSFNDSSSYMPIGYNDYSWFLSKLPLSYIFKISFNGAIIGGFIIFKTSSHNYQLERIFILPEYQNTGIGTKAISFITNRFPEAKVLFVDILPTQDIYKSFLYHCGFFESNYISNPAVRLVKLIK